MNSPEVCQCCPGLDIFTSSRYFSRQKDLHIRSGCNERYFRRPGNLQIKNRSFALFHGSADMFQSTITSISKLSVTPLWEKNIFPESSSCVDTGRMLVPKDTIKNCASTLFISQRDILLLHWPLWRFLVIVSDRTDDWFKHSKHLSTWINRHVHPGVS